MRKTLLAMAIILLMPTVLYAHVYILESIPADGSEIAEVPKKVVMVLGGSVEPTFSKLTVYNPKSKKISGNPRFLEGDTVIEVDLDQGEMLPGKYKVKWMYISLDGHKQKGTFKFTLK